MQEPIQDRRGQDMIVEPRIGSQRVMSAQFLSATRPEGPLLGT